jgi:hypothetical protein
VRQPYACALILLVAVGCGRSNYDQGYRDGYKQGLAHAFDARCAKATETPDFNAKNYPSNTYNGDPAEFPYVSTREAWIAGNRNGRTYACPTPTPAPGTHTCVYSSLPSAPNCGDVVQLTVNGHRWTAVYLCKEKS